MKMIDKKTETETEIIGLIKIKDRVAVCLPNRQWTLVANKDGVEFDDGYKNKMEPVDQMPENFLNPDGKCSVGDKEFNEFVMGVQTKGKKKKGDKN